MRTRAFTLYIYYLKDELFAVTWVFHRRSATVVSRYQTRLSMNFDLIFQDLEVEPKLVQPGVKVIKMMSDY